ncbi:MAG: hypothetical protein ACREVW_14485 [Burkholderiales bacterium]
MIDFAHDLASTFYGADFAAPFTVQRPDFGGETVMVILGAVDAEALDGRAIAASRVGRFAAGQDVRADDHLVAQEAAGPDVPPGTTLKVLDRPRRVNDGLELEALLGSVSV